MGAVLIAPRLAEPFFKPDAGVWWRTATPTPPRRRGGRGLANLAIIEREGLLDEAAGWSARLPVSWHRWPTTNVLLRCAAGPARWRPSSSASQGRRSHSRRPCGTTGWRRAPWALAVSRSPAFVMTEDQVRRLATAIRTALDT